MLLLPETIIKNDKIMKKYLLIMLAILPIVLFTACGSEEYSNSIVGAWVSSEYNSNDTVIYRNDGVVIEHEGYYDGGKLVLDYWEGDYTISKNKITIHWKAGKEWRETTKRWSDKKDAESTDIITYSLNGNILKYLDIEGESDYETLTYKRQ